MGKVYNDPETGHIFVEGNDGQIRWSSEFPPVNLLPEADWIDQPISIAFPDFSKFVNYGHTRWHNPPSQPWPGSGTWYPSSSQDTCVTLTMIEPEETVLAAIDIGTVPSGANYLDVRVKLDRLKAPYNFRDQPVPSLIPNAWVSLPGGSCMVEATEIWRRSFDIVLAGNTVQLVRRQSVIQPGPEPTSGTPPERNSWLPRAGAGGDPWGQSSYQGWGWISGNTFAGTYRAGHPAALIQQKPPSANTGMGGDTPAYGGKHPRRFNSCSIDNSAHDFSSTYTGQIVIRPGYIGS